MEQLNYQFCGMLVPLQNLHPPMFLLPPRLEVESAIFDMQPSSELLFVEDRIRSA